MTRSPPIRKRFWVGRYNNLISHSFPALTGEISSWTREKYFHIYNQPSPTTFKSFMKILQNCSDGQTNVSEQSRLLSYSSSPSSNPKWQWSSALSLIHVLLPNVPAIAGFLINLFHIKKDKIKRDFLGIPEWRLLLTTTNSSLNRLYLLYSWVFRVTKPPSPNCNSTTPGWSS